MTGVQTCALPISGGFHAYRRYEKLFFSKKHQNLAGICKKQLKLGDNVLEGFGVLRFTLAEKNADISIEILNKGEIFVRSRRQGDKIKLSEKGGTKSLKKLFTDKKIPLEQRNLIPVIEAGGEAVFVLGFGADIKYKPQKSGIKVELIKN